MASSIALSSSSNTYFEQLALSLTLQNTLNSLDSNDEQSLAEADFDEQPGVPSFSQWLLPINASSGSGHVGGLRYPAVVHPAPDPRPYFVPFEQRAPSEATIDPDYNDLQVVGRWPHAPSVDLTPGQQWGNWNTSSSEQQKSVLTAAARFVSCEANSSFQTAAGRTLFMSSGVGVSAFIVLVNTMIFIAFARERSLRRVPGHTLIVYMMVLSDVLIGSAPLPGYLLFTYCGGWPLPKVLCDLWITLDYLGTNVSYLSVAAIAFERFMAVYFVLKHRVWFHRRRQVYLVVALWGFTGMRIIISFPVWAYASGFRQREAFGSCDHPMYASPAISIMHRTVALYIPVALTFFFYGAIIVKVMQVSSDSDSGAASPTADENGDEKKGENERPRKRSDPPKLRRHSMGAQAARGSFRSRAHTGEADANSRMRALQQANAEQGATAIRTSDSAGTLNPNSIRREGDIDTQRPSSGSVVQKTLDSMRRGTAKSRSSLSQKWQNGGAAPTAMGTTPTGARCVQPGGVQFQFGNGVNSPPTTLHEKRFDNVAIVEPNNSNNNKQKEPTRKRSATVRPRSRLWKSFRIVSLVIFAFLASNLPWHFVENLRVTRVIDIKGTDTFYIISWMLTYSNALLNPIIYFFMNSQYRTAAVNCFVCRSMRSESRRLQQRRMTDYYIQQRRSSNNPTPSEFQSQSQRTTDSEYCKGTLLRVPTNSTFSDYDDSVSDSVPEHLPGPGPRATAIVSTRLGSGRRTGAGMLPPPPGFCTPSSSNTTSANGNVLDTINSLTSTALTSPTSSTNEALPEPAASSYHQPKASSLKGGRRISAGPGSRDPDVVPGPWPSESGPGLCAARKVSEVQVLIVVEEPSSVSHASTDAPHILQDWPSPESIIF